MLTLARFSIRRPWSALLVWTAVAAALAVIGFGVSKQLSPPISVVPGTQSSRAQQLANAQFGPTQLVPILIEGPKQTINRDGPALVKTLAARRYLRVLSPWDAGTAAAQLRPKPTAAMIVVSVDRTLQNTDKYEYPQIQRIVHEQIRSPLRAYVSGQPSIDLAERNASISNLRRDEAIAAGIVFLLLLIGLRAPIAAALVTVVAGVSVLAAFGEVALLGHFISLDPVGNAAGTMTGLALGVAFALLILDRFHHEERLEGVRRRAAPAATLDVQGTGRAVLVAGTAFVLALGIDALIGPTQLMVSVGAAALTCALFTIGGTVVVMPAALVLLGHRIEWLKFPAPAFAHRAWSRLVDGGSWVTRHAIWVGALATAAIAGLAVPALAMKTGPQSISLLPASSQARIAFNEIGRVMGPGWATPYNLIVVANGRPITTPAVLAGLNRFQTQIAKDGRVESVTGPGAINMTAKQLSSFEPQLKHSAKISNDSKKQLLQLIDGLGLAGAGSKQLQSGLAQAASGASQLQGGSGAAQSGAGQIHAGLTQARGGSQQLQAGLQQALSGAQALKSGAAQALTGSSQLLQGISLAQTPAAQSVPALKALSGQTATTASDVAAALAKLESMSAGKSDPAYAGALADLQAAASAAGGAKTTAAAIAYQAPGLVAALNLLHDGASQLVSGIQQLKNGNAQLADGIGQLSNGGGQLTSGLSQLEAGAGALEAGLGQLTSGAGQLASGLAGGVGPAGELITGLGTMQAAVTKARGQIPSTAQLEQLFKQSPGLFNSGYFVLAAVEGATRNDRNAAGFTINLLRGGTAGQIVVVSKYASNDARTAALGTHLVNVAKTFAKQNNLQIAVGGPQGSLGDITHVTKNRMWLDVGALSLAIILVLAIALRSIALPIVATAFALLVTAASFGVLQLLFGGSNPPLGGPGYFDPVTVISVFTIAFALSIVFSTLLLMRTREDELAGHTRSDAIRRALRATAAPGTGAGLVMLAAIAPFAVTDLINVRELGIGVAVAVILDVLLVRPVLLPAAETVLDRLHRHRPTFTPSRRGVPGRPVTH